MDQHRNQHRVLLFHSQKNLLRLGIAERKVKREESSCALGFWNVGTINDTLFSLTAILSWNNLDLAGAKSSEYFAR